MELTNSQVKSLDTLIDKLLLKYPIGVINSVAKRHDLDINTDPKSMLFRLVLSIADTPPSTVYDLEKDLQQLRSRFYAADGSTE